MTRVVAKKNWRNTNAALAMLVGVVATALPVAALAYMPNPDRKPYIDHSKEVMLGVDAADQVFAYATIKPLKDKSYNVHFRCEHNARGPASATYTVKLRQGNVELYTISQRCDLGGTSGVSIQNIPVAQWGGARGEIDRQVDLTALIDKVDNIEFWANLGSSPPVGMTCVKQEGPACVIYMRQ